MAQAAPGPSPSLQKSASPEAGRIWSDEQKAIIADRSRVLVVRAFAGTGKTTTAVGYAEARPDTRMLYICFNKAIQTEAASRFGRNVKAQTTHSLAFQAVGRQFGARVAANWRAMNVRTECQIPTWRSAAITHAVLNRFFQSEADTIEKVHAAGCDEQFRASEREIHEGLINARVLWKRMQDQGDTVSIPHDAYLKMWALSRPKLPYETIIFDEAQDANPVIARVVREQRQANLLYIGDPHQSIYGFRGATNAMDDFAEQATQLHLSKTWRFGPKTAAYANLLLKEFKHERVRIQGMGQDLPYHDGACVTKLSRTNAQLFKDAALLEGQGVHWVGGIEGYQVGKILDAHALFAGRREQIQDPFMRFFASWQEMQDYSEAVRDPETRVLTSLIEEYRDQIPALIQTIRQNEVKDASQASLILSTAHKAKGLDWDYVCLADDFEILEDTESKLKADPYGPIEEQEINLLYVAATRARKEVQLNMETLQWIQDLPRHRTERDSALAILKRRLQPGAYATP